LHAPHTRVTSTLSLHDALPILTSSPRRIHESAPTRDQADAEFERLKRNALRADANDMLYAWESSHNYNPAPQLERIKAPLVAVRSEEHTSELQSRGQLVCRLLL